MRPLLCSGSIRTSCPRWSDAPAPSAPPRRSDPSFRSPGSPSTSRRRWWARAAWPRARPSAPTARVPSCSSRPEQTRAGRPTGCRHRWRGTCPDRPPTASTARATPQVLPCRGSSRWACCVVLRTSMPWPHRLTMLLASPWSLRWPAWGLRTGVRQPKAPSRASASTHLRPTWCGPPWRDWPPRSPCSLSQPLTTWAGRSSNCGSMVDSPARRS